MTWFFKKTDKALTSDLSKQLNINPLIAQILVTRGITTAEQASCFLNPRLKLLPDPFLLTDMDRAVKRISGALKKNEQLTIFGDYDVDGVTSTALLMRFFREYEIRCNYYIPNRLTEGYGLNKKGIDYAESTGSSLIITVDNGTNAVDEVSYARSKGLDVIVTDHHELHGQLPEAEAIINPKKETSGVFHPMSGVGVAFYLAIALRKRLNNHRPFREWTKKLSTPGTDGGPNLKEYLDLVVLGTLADVVPLTGINRILVKNGVEVLKNTKNVGIRALAAAAGANLEDLDSLNIPFRLAPRINASGRLGRQELGVELLTTENANEAADLALTLNRMNIERQSIEKEITEKAKELADKESSSTILWSDNWHPGVIGIVASRMVEYFKKPCVLISVKGGSGRGSVRGIGSFHVMEALTYSADTLKNYGGHTAAAGFDIEIKNLEAFRKRFEEYTANNLKKSDGMEKIEIDAELEIKDVTPSLIDELEALSPFGEGNPKPIFSVSDCSGLWPKIVGNNHLKLKISKEGNSLDAIGFNLGEHDILPNKRYNFAGTPRFNEYNGVKSIQIQLKAIQ